MKRNSPLLLASDDITVMRWCYTPAVIKFRSSIRQAPQQGTLRGGRWLLPIPVMVYVITALMLLTISGCMTAKAAKYQKEVAMPMLIQENRQLEDELFYLREQLSRCHYENQNLREQVTTLQEKVDATPPATTSQSRRQKSKQENAAVPAWSPTR